jgi:hypothetical protein
MSLERMNEDEKMISMLAIKSQHPILLQAATTANTLMYRSNHIMSLHSTFHHLQDTSSIIRTDMKVTAGSIGLQSMAPHGHGHRRKFHGQGSDHY